MKHPAKAAMLMGASIGFMVAYFMGDLWLGILAAAFVGMLMEEISGIDMMAGLLLGL